MKLDIIVPHYKETESEIKPLLDSIALQQNIDFKCLRVILVDDGGDVYFTNEFLKSYPFRILALYQHHNGVSAARNLGLFSSDADYVMFCDADDMFIHNCGLFIIFRDAKEVNFDILVSTFTEETRTQEKEITYVNHEKDKVFVHGKVFKRDYLIENEIMFNEELTIHEDVYFNVLAQELATKIHYVDTPFYLWKWRDSSICRSSDNYRIRTYSNLLLSNDKLITELLKRGRIDSAKRTICMRIFETYFFFSHKDFKIKKNKEYIEKAESSFKQFYNKYKNFYNELSDDIKISEIINVRYRHYLDGLLFETITFDKWIKKFEEKPKKEDKWLCI